MSGFRRPSPCMWLPRRRSLEKALERGVAERGQAPFAFSGRVWNPPVCAVPPGPAVLARSSLPPARRAQGAGRGVGECVGDTCGPCAGSPPAPGHAAICSLLWRREGNAFRTPADAGGSRSLCPDPAGEVRDPVGLSGPERCCLGGGGTQDRLLSPGHLTAAENNPWSCSYLVLRRHADVSRRPRASKKAVSPVADVKAGSSRVWPWKTLLPCG